MTAVVAPIGVEDAEFRFERVAALLAEVLHHFVQVVLVHGEAVGAAETGVVGRSHFGEAGEIFERLHFGVVVQRQNFHVFGAAFHRVDDVVADAGEVLIGEAAVEDQQARAADLDLGGGVDEMGAINSGGGPLVELSRDELHGEEFLPVERVFLRDVVGNGLTENTVATFLHQVVAETEKVIDIEESQFFEVEGEIFIEFGEQALCLHAELFLLFNKNTSCFHNGFV